MFSITEAQLAAWLSPIFWPFLRILAVFSVSPVFSVRSVPVRARIGLAFFVALAAQAVLEGQPQISVNGPEALGTAATQVVIGLAIGFAVRVVFSCVELAGELVGLQMGLNFAGFFDPGSHTQGSAVGTFFSTLTVLLFVVLNGHLMVLMAVVRSFESFPVDANLLNTLGQLKLYQLGTDLFASALWIALPMIGMLMLVNLTLGIISRVAPQMNIYAIGFPVTLTTGLIGMAATLPMLEPPFLQIMERAVGLFGAR